MAFLINRQVHHYQHHLIVYIIIIIIIIVIVIIITIIIITTTTTTTIIIIINIFIKFTFLPWQTSTFYWWLDLITWSLPWLILIKLLFRDFNDKSRPVSDVATVVIVSTFLLLLLLLLLRFIRCLYLEWLFDTTVNS